MAKAHSFLSALAAVSLAALLSGCDNFFGDKTSDSFITPPVPDTRQVTYVAVQPSFTGFGLPTAIVAGNDQLFYVVDSARQELVCLNQSGVRLASRVIPGITAVAQDRRLDLIVLGRIDYPAASGELVNVPAIYRLNLKQQVGYGLANAVITDTIIQPFYFSRTRGIEPRDNQVRFNGVAILPDNRFLVTRTGPGVEVATGVPDDAVLLFDTDRGRFTTISITGEGGASFNNYFRKPFGIATIPPAQQVLTGRESQDFIVTTHDELQDTVLRVKYIQTNVSPEGISYQVKNLPLPNDTSIRGSLYQSYKFRRPMGVTIANDQTGFIFVTDKDSLFQFTSEGYEGVRLVASTIRRGYNKVSFGGKGSGPYKFNGPAGVAYLNRIVYVADSRNGEIKRYRLSTDFQ